MNDVLDLNAMTSGEFKLQPKLVTISVELLQTLRRCRAYLPPDVILQYHLPARRVGCSVDMLRVSQILTNAMR